MKSNKNNIFAVFFILVIFGLNGCAALDFASNTLDVVSDSAGATLDFVDNTLDVVSDQLESINSNISTVGFDGDGIAIVPVTLDSRIQRKKQGGSPMEGIITGVITSNITFLGDILIPSGTPIEAEYQIEPGTYKTLLRAYITKIKTADKTIETYCPEQEKPYCLLKKDYERNPEYTEEDTSESRTLRNREASDSSEDNLNANSNLINSFSTYYTFRFTRDNVSHLIEDDSISTVGVDAEGIAMVPVKLDSRIERKKKGGSPMQGTVTGVITANVEFVGDILIPSGTPIEAEYQIEPGKYYGRLRAYITKIKTADKTIEPYCPKQPGSQCLLKRDFERDYTYTAADISSGSHRSRERSLGYTNLSDKSENNDMSISNVVNSFTTYYTFDLPVYQLEDN